MLHGDSVVREDERTGDSSISAGSSLRLRLRRVRGLRRSGQAKQGAGGPAALPIAPEAMIERLGNVTGQLGQHSGCLQWVCSVGVLLRRWPICLDTFLNDAMESVCPHLIHPIHRLPAISAHKTPPKLSLSSSNACSCDREPSLSYS